MEQLLTFEQLRSFDPKKATPKQYKGYIDEIYRRLYLNDTTDASISTIEQSFANCKIQEDGATPETKNRGGKN